ncbi:HTH-type transcriptional regulator [Pandoraea commovens]|uniref:HTH-type transcriptional regulator n=1 Tax=Pandoraea commovens TaxID=2508289 RepID=A0A5E4VC08_9BURK|nr:HTH-type transcriptional regulator [Pandoraea commovens]
MERVAEAFPEKFNTKVFALVFIATILKHMLDHDNTLDLTFQALADASRRAMLVRLAQGPASVSALAQPLSMSLQAVMQHLSVLESAGLVRTEKAGRVRTCRIEPQALSLAERWINQRRHEWEGHLDRLGEYLASLPPEGDLHDDSK